MSVFVISFTAARAKRRRSTKKSTISAGSIFSYVDAIEPTAGKPGTDLNKARLEIVLDKFLKNRNIAFEAYTEVASYFARRPEVQASMLLITADRPWQIDYACLSKVLLPGRLGMVTVRALQGRDMLIDAIVKVCAVVLLCLFVCSFLFVLLIFLLYH